MHGFMFSVAADVKVDEGKHKVWHLAHYLPKFRIQLLLALAAVLFMTTHSKLPSTRDPPLCWKAARMLSSAASLAMRAFHL